MSNCEEQVADLINSVKESAEENKEAKEQTFKIMDVDDAVRQGDLYITRIAEVPSDAIPTKLQAGQLAEGNTQGSRHIMTHDSMVNSEIFVRANPDALQGPIVEAKSAWTVTHPEHGNFNLPAGTFSVTYQQAYAEELRRVMD